MKQSQLLLVAACAALAVTAACSTTESAGREWEELDTATLSEVVVTAERPEPAVAEVVVTANGPGLVLDEVVVRAARPGPVGVDVSDSKSGGYLVN